MVRENTDEFEWLPIEAMNPGSGSRNCASNLVIRKDKDTQPLMSERLLSS